MKRDPSIHLRLSDLTKVLAKMGYEDPDEMAMTIMNFGLPYAIKDRYVVKGDYATRAKAVKSISAEKDMTVSVEKFNTILTAVRINAGHTKNLVPIRKNDSQWLTLKEVAQIANDFAIANEFESREEGMQMYLTMAMQFMPYASQFSLSRLKGNKDKVYAKYESAMTIKFDTDKEGTQRMYAIWQELMQEYGNLKRDLTDYSEYVYMVYCRIEADNLQADYRDYLTAQFESFTYMSLVPNLNQLIADKAVTRYYDYMANTAGERRARKQALSNKSTEVERTEFMEQYFANIRNKKGATN